MIEVHKSRFLFIGIMGLFLLNGCKSGQNYIPFEKNNKVDEIALSEKIILSDNEAYLDYCRALRKKIYNYAYKNYRYLKTGEVNLYFRLKNNGKLIATEVNQSRSKASNDLITAAVKAVKQAAPFSPFPNSLQDNPYLDFEIRIGFELENQK